MKALILSDLHISYEYYHASLKYKRILNANIKEPYDIVIISGDLFEASIMTSEFNPYELLNTFFDGKPVIFCLGNHEFAHKDFSEVMNYWRTLPSVKNIHCLDVENFVDLNGHRFVGNVFWYDWSMNLCPMLMHGELLDSWLDSTISNFDPEHENMVCKKAILDNASKDVGNILVTHTVPYWKLNRFSVEEPQSPYNAYSGCKNFLAEMKEAGLRVEFAFCGHTHKRELGTFEGVDCYNIGNDYLFRSGLIEHMIVEI